MVNNISQLQLASGRDLAQTAKAIARSLERLSSGKITGAHSGETMLTNWESRISSQIRGLRQATLGVNQAISMANMASSGLNQQVDLLTRMKEIAIAGANSLLASDERLALNEEMQSLYDQFDAIARQTEMANQNLLDGSFTTKQIQLGSARGDKTNMSIAGSTKEISFSSSYYMGSGSFSAATTNAILTISKGTLADMDGDGENELITIGSSVLQIFASNGDGTFSEVSSRAASASVYSARAIDINNDGNLDISLSSASGAVAIYFGNGDGTVQTASTISVHSDHIRTHQYLDFNSDGKLDLIASEGDANAHIAVALGNGDGTFQTRTTIATTTDNIWHSYVADMNNDGIKDVIFSGEGNVSAFYQSALLLNNGNGTFQTAKTKALSTTLSGAGQAFAVGDFNNDTYVDFLATNTTSAVRFYSGNGDGTFASGATFSPAASVSSSDNYVGDINEDGNLDFILENSAAYVYLGNGNGTFSLRDTFAIGSNLFADDFNGDDMIDVVGGGTAMKLALGEGTADIRAADLSVLSQEDAENAIDSIEDALDRVHENMASISALHSRLNSTVASNLLWADNLEEARQIATQTDFTEEVANLVVQQMRSDGQIASLAQANISWQLVAQLLEF